jgi:hypothetical protein
MYMKKISLLTAICLSAMITKAQLTIDNATFFIQSGATVTVQGDVTSNVDIQGTGLLQLKGSSNQNVNMNGFTIPNLEIDNTSNASLTGHARIGTSMLFTNGKINLGTFNMTLASAATVTGHNNARFFVTNNTGVLTRQSLGAVAFTYPVGFSATEYNPVIITNNGTTDDISVRCLQNVLANGTSGAALTTDFASNSWVVSEALAGGSNLNVTGEWVVGDELPGFNRNKSGVARFTAGTDWDLPASNVQAAAGAGPYTRNRTGMTTVGVYAIADLENVNAAKLNLKVFLQGPLSAGVMGDGLRSSNLIPLTQPYTAGLNAFYDRTGSVYDGTVGANETVPSNAVLDVAGTNDDIVDWVFISMQDGTTPATRLQTKVAMVQRDGDIVEYDALSATYVPVRMPIDADGNYHIVVSHRNHLGIRTATTMLLQDGIISSYNFTTAQAQAIGPNGMVQVGSVFAMWAGDVNASGTVLNTASPSDASLVVNGVANRAGNTLHLSGYSGYINVYDLLDVNLDGKVFNTASPSDAAIIVNNVANYPTNALHLSSFTGLTRKL